MIKLKKTVKSPYTRCYCLVKTALDRGLALVAILLLLPLFAAIAFGIRCTSRGPVLFRQVRMGRGMEPFLVYKFRTMSCRAPRYCATAELCAPRQYMTAFGSFLRKTSLDELPQLWNVLRGEMSLLGPRPVILSEDELISRRACAGVYAVRPGLSGLSQVAGRDLLNNEEKTRLDGEYVQHLSFWRDAWLLVVTVFAAAFHRGIREGAPGRVDQGGKTIVRK